MFDWMRSICIFNIIECIIMLIKYLILFISSRYHMEENEKQNDKINSNELFNILIEYRFIISKRWGLWILQGPFSCNVDFSSLILVSSQESRWILKFYFSTEFYNTDCQLSNWRTTNNFRWSTSTSFSTVYVVVVVVILQANRINFFFCLFDAVNANTINSFQAPNVNCSS